MYEFFGFFSLSLTTSGEDEDPETHRVAIETIAARVSAGSWPTSSVEVRQHNDEPYLVFSGLVNRRRFEADQLEDVVQEIGRLLPGSYGLWYERDDARSEPPGPDAFRVRVMRRGVLSTEPDPFLSPVVPMIEDEFDDGAGPM